MNRRQFLRTSPCLPLIAWITPATATQDVSVEYRVTRWQIIHKECNGIAFYCLHRPVLGERILPKDYVLLDGSTPIAGQAMACGSCGEDIIGRGFFPMRIGNAEASQV